jgi:hypothetical protein
MSHAEYMLARENLFGVSQEKVARIAPSWRPPGVPVDLNLTGLADGWYDFSIHVRRSIMSMVLSHIVVHTPRQRSGYFNPERLEPHWLHGDPVSEPPPFERRRRADHFWDHPAGHRPTPRPEIDPTLLAGCGRTLDPAEASVLTGLTCHQLGLARRKGDLHATKVGRAFRYDEEELNRYLTWRAVQRDKWLTQRRSQRHTARHQGQYWSGREVREYLDIGPTTLRRLVTEGLLTEARLRSRLYAYPRNEVVSLVEQSRVQPSRRATTARLRRNNAPLP